MSDRSFCIAPLFVAPQPSLSDSLKNLQGIWHCDDTDSALAIELVRSSMLLGQFNQLPLSEPPESPFVYFQSTPLNSGFRAEMGEYQLCLHPLHDHLKLEIYRVWNFNAKANLPDCRETGERWPAWSSDTQMIHGQFEGKQLKLYRGQQVIDGLVDREGGKEAPSSPWVFKNSDGLEVKLIQQGMLWLGEARTLCQTLWLRKAEAITHYDSPLPEQRWYFGSIEASVPAGLLLCNTVDGRRHVLGWNRPNRQYQTAGAYFRSIIDSGSENFRWQVGDKQTFEFIKQNNGWRFVSHGERGKFTGRLYEQAPQSEAPPLIEKLIASYLQQQNQSQQHHGDLATYCGSQQSWPAVQPRPDEQVDVTWLYLGEAKDVCLMSDINSWIPDTLPFTNIEISGVHYLKLTLPDDFRSDYKLLVDGQEILDPLNPNKVKRNLGSYVNSYIEGPNAKDRLSDISLHKIDENRFQSITLYSQAFKQERHLWLYQPEAPAEQVLYVHDGDLALGDAYYRQIVDDLTRQMKIRPTLLVGIPPVNRFQEYAMHRGYFHFVVNEVIPRVEGSLAQSPYQGKRFMSGISMGSLVSLFISCHQPKLFNRLGLQSPAGPSPLTAATQQLLLEHPLAMEKIWLEVASLDYADWVELAQQLKPSLKAMCNGFEWHKSNGGHSYGNYAQTTPAMLGFLLS